MIRMIHQGNEFEESEEETKGSVVFPVEEKPVENSVENSVPIPVIDPETADVEEAEVLEGELEAEPEVVPEVEGQEVQLQDPFVIISEGKQQDPNPSGT